MITLTGIFIPNIEYYYRNSNTFQYPKEGIPDIVIGALQHEGSGSVSGMGAFSLELYPTDYLIEFGKGRHTTYFYKDLNSGTDSETVDFGGTKVFLSGTGWLSQHV